MPDSLTARTGAAPDRSSSRIARLLDAAHRVAYRMGFPLARLWWALRRPKHRGAIVAVWVDRRVLMLRPSYRSSYDFPGGGIGPGEEARAAARRELFEEAGIAAAAEALTFVGEMVAWRDFRRDHCSIFELRLEAAPAVRVDRREIVAAAFLPPEAVLALPVSPFVRAYLEGAAVS